MIDARMIGWLTTCTPVLTTGWTTMAATQHQKHACLPRTSPDIALENSKARPGHASDDGSDSSIRGPQGLRVRGKIPATLRLEARLRHGRRLPEREVHDRREGRADEVGRGRVSFIVAHSSAVARVLTAGRVGGVMMRCDSFRESFEASRDAARASCLAKAAKGVQNCAQAPAAAALVTAGTRMNLRNNRQLMRLPGRPVAQNRLRLLHC